MINVFHSQCEIQSPFPLLQYNDVLSQNNKTIRYRKLKICKNVTRCSLNSHLWVISIVTELGENPGFEL